MKSSKQKETIRGRVLGVLASAPRLLTGMEVARAAGVPYKAVVDALNRLNEYGRVRRRGRKFKARWGRIEADEPGKQLDRIALGMVSEKKGESW